MIVDGDGDGDDPNASNPDRPYSSGLPSYRSATGSPKPGYPEVVAVAVAVKVHDHVNVKSV